MGDMIDRDAALAIEGQLAKSMAHFLRVEQWQAYKAGVQEYRGAVAALPAVTVGVKLPPIEEELYEHYPSMSAQTHSDLVQDYARKAILAALEPQPAPDAAAIREAALVLLSSPEALSTMTDELLRGANVNTPTREDAACVEQCLREALALITEKPHDRA